MLKLTTIQKYAEKLEILARIEKMTGGGNGLFVKLEVTVDGKAKPVERWRESALMNYLKRYKVKWEYRGFMCMFISEEVNNR